MSLGSNARFCIILSIFSLLLLLSSSFVPFFHDSSPFYLYLFSISFQVKLDSLSPLHLFSSISNAQKTCKISSSTIFKDICSSLASFESAGVLYFIISLVVLLCILNNISGLWWLVYKRTRPRLEFTNYLAPGLYLTALASYFTLCTAVNTQHHLHADLGVGLGVVIFIVLLLNCLWYYGKIKGDYAEEFEVLEENTGSRVEIRENIGNFSVAPRMINDTGNSDDELARRLTKRSFLANQGTQIDEIAVKDTISIEISQLLQEKTRLEESTNRLKMLIDSSSPDIAVYKSNIENKNTELITCKNLISTFKEMLIEKDIRLEELTRDLEVNKSIIESLATEKELPLHLAKQLENFKKENNSLQNWKSFEDISEKDSRSQISPSIDRVTDSTRFGSDLQSERYSLYTKLEYLNKALEAQKDLNEKLHLKNKSLENIKEKNQDFKGKSKSIDIGMPDGKKLKNQNIEKFEEILKDKEIELEEIRTDRNRLGEDLRTAKETLGGIRDQFFELTNNLTQRQNEWEFEKTDFAYVKNMMSREIEQLKQRVKLQEENLYFEVNKASNEIDKLNDSLKFYMAELDLANNEISRLKALKMEAIGDSDMEKLNSYTKLLLEQDQRTEKSFLEIDKSFHSILNEKDDLRKEIMDRDETIQVLSEENIKLSQEIFNFKRSQILNSNESVRVSDHTYGSQPSEGSSLNSYLSMQDLMIIESISDINPHSNPLLQTSIRLRKEPPMIYSNLWKLMEALMEEKCIVDKLDFALGRSPRSLPDFTLDFLNLHYGLNTLAQKQLKALTNSLEELNKLGHPYGIFFCRLLGIHHFRPIPTFLSVYLLQIQHFFNALALKCAKQKQKFAENYEILQYGGQASIVDVMELIMKVCKNNRKIGERIISSLHKENEKRLEISLLKACGTMARTGASPSHFFKLLDINDTKSLDYHEFVDGIRFTLGIWVSQLEAEDICSFIDIDGNGVITLEEWVEKVDFTEYSRKVYEKEAMVTKMQVLGAFIEEYEVEMLEEYNKLRQMVKIRSLDQPAFEEFIKKIDPGLENHEAISMFTQLKKSEKTQNVSAEGLCVMILNKQIGGYGLGIFSNSDLFALV